MTFDFKKLLPHALVVAIFIALTLVFFYPVIEGKDLQQGDMTHAAGMRQEIEQFEKQTGELSQWTNAMFSGMPAYQIYKGGSPYNIYSVMFKAMRIGLPYNTIAILFCYLISFYVLLLTLRFNHWLAAVGAIAFCFASYNVIIIEAGHITKAYAIAFIPLVVAGVLKIFENKYIVGTVLLTIALGLEINSNHPQITYYLGLGLVFYFASQLYYAVKNKDVKNYFIKCALVVASGLIALLPNLTLLWTTYEYGKDSLRGASELTPKAGEKASSGLDREYAFGWSYGKAETGTLLIPNFMGGSCNSALDNESESYKVLQSNGVPNANEIVQRMPMYWGDQPFTSGPVYIGAIVCFLFVLALFLVKGQEKWWLVLATLFSIAISWGKNFPAFNDFLFDYFPMYNKFRAVSMALVVAGFTIPFLALLGLNQILAKTFSKEQIIKYVKYSLYIVGGFVLLFVIAPGMFFNFSSSSDEQLIQSGFPDWLVTAIRADRQAMLRSDAIRSLVFILLSAGVIWAYVSDKLKQIPAIALLGALLVFDLIPVGKRFLTKDNFVSKRDVSIPYQMTAANEAILKDTDPNFRVFNVTVSPFNDASTSYFHKSIGGYHGAKMRRYQELWDAHISQNNMNVINMLNTKYFIVQGPDKQPMAQKNPNAMGNAWFVENIKWVNNADEELATLDSTFNPAKMAVVDVRFKDKLAAFKSIIVDSSNTDNIKLVSYKPNHLQYKSTAKTERLAVFSEIYYDKGWNVSIDGKEVDYSRANYVLRSMLVPAGEHTIDFKFEPKSYKVGNQLAIVGSVLLVLLVGAAIFMQLKSKKK
jgi:hypothetical protein